MNEPDNLKRLRLLRASAWARRYLASFHAVHAQELTNVRAEIHLADAELDVLDAMAAIAVDTHRDHWDVDSQRVTDTLAMAAMDALAQAERDDDPNDADQG